MADRSVSSRVRRFGDGNAGFPNSIRFAVSHGTELDRPLSKAERRAVAVLIAQPTHILTISSKIEDPVEHSNAFRRFRKRLSEKLKKPWVYVAVPARERSADRFHLHCVHWDFIPGGIIRKHSRESGLGENPKFRYIAEQDVFEQGDRVLYELAQNVPLFGLTHHLRHRPPPRHSKVFRCPKNKTLEIEKPNLLSALRMAQSRSVSDLQLLSEAPYFNNMLHPKVREQEGT